MSTKKKKTASKANPTPLKKASVTAKTNGKSAKATKPNEKQKPVAAKTKSALAPTTKPSAKPAAPTKIAANKPVKDAAGAKPAAKAAKSTVAESKTTKSAAPSKTAPTLKASPAKARPVVEAKKQDKVISKQTAEASKQKVAPTKGVTASKATKSESKVVEKHSAKTSAKAVDKPTKNGSLSRTDAPHSPLAAPKSKATKPVAAPKKPAMEVPPPSNTKPEIVAKIRSAQAERELRKDLAQPAPKTSLTLLTPIPVSEKGKDRIILMVRDPYWLHAHWDVTRQSVDRAKAALAENWHTVKPILRLLKLDDTGTTNNAETIHRDVEIHGGVRNWYLEVDSPPSRFKILMGYLSSTGRFYELVRSNTVTTPAPGGKEATDDHWADIAKDAERIYAMSGGYGDETQTGDLPEVFEERLKRTMDADVLSQFGSGAESGLKRHRQFHFDVDAELIVFGSTHPDAHVIVGSEPVKVRTDGSFSIRLPLPDRRQVLPATAKSRDGVDEQTVVIAVERNTKVMEPLSMEPDDS